MSDTESTTPEGSAQLDVNGAANAILGLMGTDDGPNRNNQNSAQNPTIAMPNQRNTRNRTNLR